MRPLDFIKPSVILIIFLVFLLPANSSAQVLFKGSNSIKARYHHPDVTISRILNRIPDKVNENEILKDSALRASFDTLAGIYNKSAGIKDIIDLFCSGHIKHTADKKYFYFYDYWDYVKVYDADTFEEVISIPPNGQIYDLLVTPDNKYIVIHLKNKIHIRNFEDGSLVPFEIFHDGGGANNLELSKDGTRLYSYSSIWGLISTSDSRLSSSIKVWDLNTGELIDKLNDSYDNFDVSNDGKMIVVSEYMKPVHVKDANDLSNNLLSFDVLCDTLNGSFLLPQAQFSPDSKYIITQIDKGILVKDILSGRILYKIDDFPERIGEICISPDSKFIAVSNALGDNESSYVKFFDLKTGVEIFNRLNPGYRARFKGLKIFDNCRDILITGMDGSQIWNIETGLPSSAPVPERYSFLMYNGQDYFWTYSGMIVKYNPITYQQLVDYYRKN